MKTKLPVIVTLLLSIYTFSQQSINYKAVVKDVSGNVVSNSEIKIRFKILEGSAQTTVYQEMHTVITNSDGLVILNIGEGDTINGSYNAINWADNSHFLNVEINIEGTFVDIGTTEFLAVPYALSAANATGLRQLTESGNRKGFRLFDKDSNNYGNIHSRIRNQGFQLLSKKFRKTTNR